eukprot:scaffold26432_cov33-Tisochrysis_lutea.AAC.6
MRDRERVGPVIDLAPRRAEARRGPPPSSFSSLLSSLTSIVSCSIRLSLRPPPRLLFFSLSSPARFCPSNSFSLSLISHVPSNPFHKNSWCLSSSRLSLFSPLSQKGERGGAKVPRGSARAGTSPSPSLSRAPQPAAALGAVGVCV